jgi:hypothetical protein
MTCQGILPLCPGRTGRGPFRPRREVGPLRRARPPAWQSIVGDRGKDAPLHMRDPHARTHAVRPARLGRAPVRPREAESGRPRTSRAPLRALAPLPASTWPEGSKSVREPSATLAPLAPLAPLLPPKMAVLGGQGGGQGAHFCSEGGGGGGGQGPPSGGQGGGQGPCFCSEGGGGGRGFCRPTGSCRRLTCRHRP